jgi:hypothetical protein
MATRIYEVALDAPHFEVTEGVGSSITAGKAVAVTVDLAVATSRIQAIEALERIKQYIIEDVYPPA